MRTLLALALTLVLSAFAFAQSEQGDAAFLERVYTTGSFGEEPVTEMVRSQVPDAVLGAVVASLKEIAGDVVSVTGEDGLYTLLTETHSIEATLSRDGEGRVSGLRFAPPVVLAGDPDDIAASVAELPGETAITIVMNNEMIAAHEPDRPLAVGSAFKLAVLAELDARIETGELRPEQVVRLSEEHRSLPSGILQNLPEGHPLTVASAARLMMLLSDNTASDLLIALLGRKPIAKRLGIDDLLSTREFFVLKSKPELASAWNENPAGRNAIRSAVALAPLPSADGITPLTPGVEWYVPASRLCEIASGGLGSPFADALAGLASPDEWDAVMQKSGSEIGVLNHTVAVRLGEQTGCVSATLNVEGGHDEADAVRLGGAVMAALAAIRERMVEEDAVASP